MPRGVDFRATQLYSSPVPRHLLFYIFLLCAISTSKLHAIDTHQPDNSCKNSLGNGGPQLNIAAILKSAQLNQASIAASTKQVAGNITIRPDAKKAAEMFRKIFLKRIKEVLGVYTFKLAANPFAQTRTHKELIIDIGKELLIKTLPPEHIKELGLDQSPEIKLDAFEEAVKIEGHYLELKLDSTLAGSSDTLRLIISSNIKNQGMLVRIELRSKESALLDINDPKAEPSEAITFDVFTKDKGLSWDGVYSHTKADKKYKPRLRFQRLQIEDIDLITKVQEAKIFEIASTQDEENAIAHLHAQAKDPENAFKAVLLLPPRPQKTDDAATYSEFNHSFSAISDKLRFKNKKDLRNFLKKFLTEHIKNPKNKSNLNIDMLLAEIEDGQPVLLLLDHFNNFIYSPKHLKNGLSDPLILNGLNRTLIDFIEHAKLIDLVHKATYLRMKGMHDNSAKSAQVLLTEETALGTPDEATPDVDSTLNQNLSTESALHPNNTESESLRAKVEEQRLRIEKLEKELAQHQAEQLRLAEDKALEIAADEITLKDQKIAALEIKLHSSKSAENSLRERILSLERAGTLSEAELQRLRELEVQGISSVKNAVAFASALHPNSFAINAQAQKQLDSLSVSDARDLELSQEIYSSLTGLWHILWKQGAPKNLESKAALFKQLTGLDIAFDETSVTKEKLIAQEERSFVFEGTTYIAWPHIKLSNKKRIYFAIDHEKKRIIIHSWPKHLWTHHDGSMK